jgi:hypothetical protein
LSDKKIISPAGDAWSAISVGIAKLLIEDDKTGALLALRDARDSFPDSAPARLAFQEVAQLEADDPDANDVYWQVAPLFEKATWDFLIEGNSESALGVVTAVEAMTTEAIWEDNLFSIVIAQAIALADVGRFDDVGELLTGIGASSEDDGVREWTDDESVARGCLEVGRGDFAAAAVSLAGSHTPGLATVLVHLAQSVLLDAAGRPEDSSTAVQSALMAFLACSELRDWIGNPR